MSEPVCLTCQRSQAELPAPLKRCGRCQQVQYCSTECQRANWPEHKRTCLRQTNTPNAQAALRATFRLHDTPKSFPDNESILFIRKTTPHLDDTTIAGPFYPRTTIIEQIMGNFHHNSQAGMNIMQEICDTNGTLEQLDSIRAPLDSDLSKIMLIEVLSYHNPSMAGRLPGPAYTVISTVPMMLQEIAIREAGGSRSPHPRIKQMEVHGCYANSREANIKAEEVGQDFERGIRQSTRAGRGIDRQSGGVYFSVVGKGSDDQIKAVAIEVRYDSGQVARYT